MRVIVFLRDRLSFYVYLFGTYNPELFEEYVLVNNGAKWLQPFTYAVQS